jgi:hypothetical protein
MSLFADKPSRGARSPAAGERSVLRPCRLDAKCRQQLGSITFVQSVLDVAIRTASRADCDGVGAIALDGVHCGPFGWPRSLSADCPGAAAMSGFAPTSSRSDAPRFRIPAFSPMNSSRPTRPELRSGFASQTRLRRAPGPSPQVGARQRPLGFAEPPPRPLRGRLVLLRRHFPEHCAKLLRSTSLAGKSDYSPGAIKPGTER